jgi:chromosome segregation ATPase
MQASGSAPVVRTRSQSSSSTQAGASGVAGIEEQQHAACRQEAGRLRDKITYLEKQLDRTENSLRTNQNLASENCARTYELNSQLVQLKMALNEANRTLEEQRLKLDKKEELIRKIADDKNELLERYSTLSHNKNKLLER